MNKNGDINNLPYIPWLDKVAFIPGRLGFLRLFAFGKIIDIGCGLGTTFDGAVNLDILPNEEMIKIVEKQDSVLYNWFKILFPDGKTPNYVQADATKKIPYGDKHFDCAVLSEVIEHLDENETINILKESARVADFVIISTPNEWEWPEHIAFNKNVDGTKRLGKGVWTGHKLFHTQETLTKIIKDAGLTLLLYLKVNLSYMGLSHHVVVATTTHVAPVVYRWGLGYGLGLTIQGMPVTADEIITYIPSDKLKKKTKDEIDELEHRQP